MMGFPLRAPSEGGLGGDSPCEITGGLRGQVALPPLRPRHPQRPVATSLLLLDGLQYTVRATTLPTGFSLVALQVVQ